MTVATEPDARAPRRRIGEPLYWALGLLVLTLAALVVLRARSRSTERLPVLWQLPAWRLLDQNGAPFGSRELRGQIYVANFIFTTCALECPRLTREMGHLQPLVQRLAPGVHLVSISVDPVDDTPARLREYMTHYHADPAVWTFVTGPADDVLRAVSEGFRVGVEQPVRGPHGEFNPIELAHSNRFALVDGRGQLRATFEADEQGLARVSEALEALRRER